MKEFFGTLPCGGSAYLYTITHGKLTACITDLGATLVKLFVPDDKGTAEDVVLGFDDPQGYLNSTTYLGATVGRNANRIGGAAFTLGGTEYTMAANENGNNLHSGPDGYDKRLWEVVSHKKDSITLQLNSPDGDQGFPGDAVIRVTYALSHDSLTLTYDAVSNKDTVFNLTNHSYFNLAGQADTAAAMDQELIVPGRFFNAADAESIPTGELRRVEDTPLDFRTPKAIGERIDTDYDALNLQGGYDHNYEVFCQPAAILRCEKSGREMAVYTDCPGIQFYAGNFLNDIGKAGIHYHKRSGICLETQFWPDALHHSDWAQPVTPAGQHWRSVTIYKF